MCSCVEGEEGAESLGVDPMVLAPPHPHPWANALTRCCPPHSRALLPGARKQDEAGKLEVLAARRAASVDRVRAGLKRMAWLEVAGVGVRVGKTD
jgi:hypothetical protein